MANFPAYQLPVSPPLATYAVGVGYALPTLPFFAPYNTPSGYRVVEVGGAGIPPTVVFVSPAPASTITSTTPIVVDVTDVDTASPFVFFFVRTVDGAQEVAWDGAAFSSPYASSTRVAIVDGFRYTLRRTGGWVAGGITIRTNAIDDTGGFAT
jgi:hypothetical protein